MTERDELFMRNTDAFSSTSRPILVSARHPSPSSGSTSGLISMCWRLGWSGRPDWPRVSGNVRSSGPVRFATPLG